MLLTGECYFNISILFSRELILSNSAGFTDFSASVNKKMLAMVFENFWTGGSSVIIESKVTDITEAIKMLNIPESIMFNIYSMGLPSYHAKLS